MVATAANAPLRYRRSTFKHQVGASEYLFCTAEAISCRWLGVQQPEFQGGFNSYRQYQDILNYPGILTEHSDLDNWVDCT